MNLVFSKIVQSNSTVVYTDRISARYRDEAMISIQLNQQDLAGIRFAYSPLIETSMSIWIRHGSWEKSYFQQWLNETEEAYRSLYLPYTEAAILSKHFIADFITPPPISPFATLEDELASLRQTPAHVIRQNIEFIIRNQPATPYHEHYLTHPHEAIECLIAELRHYWERVIAPEWQRISLILEKDILYRARQMALYGLANTFSDLSSYLAYSSNEIKIDKNITPNEPSFYRYEYKSEGAGLHLVPTFFKSGYGISWQLTDDFQPIIIYQARGTGLWHDHHTESDSNQAMELVMGAGKTKLLQSLMYPSTTGELAHRLEVTAGAISQHLKGLTQAGLIISHRQGNHVYHELSERGKKLVALFGE